MGQRSPSRRALLRIGGLGIAGLAGCLSRSNEDEQSNRQTTGQQTTTQTRTASPSPTTTTTQEPTTEKSTTEKPTQEPTTQKQTTEEDTPNESADTGGGSVVLTFDDGLNSVYERAFPIMKEYDFPGLSVVVCDRIDIREPHSEELTTGELTEMQAAGWDIGGHSYSEHPDFTDLSKSELHWQCKRQIEWLKKNRFFNSTPSIVYPYNGVNERVANICEEYFDLGFGGHTQPKDGIEDPLSVGRVSGHELETAKEAISAAGEKGYTVVLMYHDITVRSKKDNDTSVEEFRETMKHIDRYDDRLEVITPSKLYKTIT